MNNFSISPIGTVRNNKDVIFIEVEQKYIPALKALSGFGHVNILWWFSNCDTEKDRSIVQIESPYKNSPDIMGIFATRSPQRPNPIAQTTVQVLNIDFKLGRIYIPFIDAIDGSPVLDIKPYTPSLDRVENPETPDWCSNWPKSTEMSGEFDWSQVFNFK